MIEYLNEKTWELKKLKAELEASLAESKKKLSAQEEQTKRATQATHTTSGVRRELKKAQTDRQRAVDHAGALQTEVDEAHARAQVAEDSLERVTRRTEGTLAHACCSLVYHPSGP